jgi:hypothetical protein
MSKNRKLNKIGFAGRCIWYRLSDKKPTESQLHNGRAPAIDSDGYLVVALFIDGNPICDFPIVMWAEIDQPDIKD